jgi:cytoplasmic iron level regulating protein YaaA (DUF328/UPF0246 family)
VLVLLPPSEGKTAPRSGRPLDLTTLSFPALAATRERVLQALVDLAARRPEQAMRALGLSPGQRPEIERDAGLCTASAAPAGTVYTGVLYEALDLAGLDAAARRRARSTLVISSALFGAVRVSDRIPAYRLSAGVTLPGVGGLNALWRAPLATAMAEAAGRGLVVDLRSGGYAAMWSPDPDTARRTVSVRVLHERPDGTRAVVSHFNKATKGRLVRSLLTGSGPPRDPDSLAHRCDALGFHVELAAPLRRGAQHRLDVVVEHV